MNTTPDETMLALWLDDELEGEQRAAMDAWALTQPAQLAAREELRQYRATMQAAIPASVEPPYPDFFNSRIEKSIRELAASPRVPAAQTAASRPWWSSWLLPVSAVAGMVFTFWMGAQTAGMRGSATPSVYTPESGVNAEWFASASADATVILLEGVEAIPDSLDFSSAAFVAPDDDGRAMVALPLSRKGERTQ
jgi:anti-sigma factor RsiW